MNIDYHFYATYAICRLAGMRDEAARTISYACQYTDDAKYEKDIEFEDGGRFVQQMSAHAFIDMDVLSKSTGYDIFIPFHFLPCGEGDNLSKKLICKRDSAVANAMLEDCILTMEKPYGLHRLGIALHAYADTWAHEDFIGILNDLNEVDDIDLENLDQWDIEEFFTNRLIPNFIPPIGHGEALTYPDEPYLKWSYKSGVTLKRQHVNNPEKFMECSTRIFEFLDTKLKKSYPDLFESEAGDWEKFRDDFEGILIHRGSVDKRTELWKNSFNNRRLGFESHVTYRENDWFEGAVELVDKENNIFKKKKDFHRSDWKLFHDAVLVHRFFIKNEALPAYDIII